MIWSALFVIHVAQVTPQIIWWWGEGKKQLWNWATTSPCRRLVPWGTLLEKLYNCERGGRPWLLTPLCVKLGKDFHDLGKTETDKTWNRIRFCSALYQVCIYFILFYCWLVIIYLSIFFFHSPFMNSGLASEGNHIVTSHHHPNFPGVPPGAAGRVQW